MRGVLVILLFIFLVSAPAEPQDRRRGDPWERMSRYDTNGDGEVSREEFRGPAQLFDRLDANADGAVTKAEVEEMMRSRRGGRRTAGRTPGAAAGGQGLAWIFKRLDLDSDGGLDDDELAAMLREGDADEDGKLSEKEFLDHLKKDLVAPPRGEAPEKGAKAPEFELKRLDGEEEVSLASLVKKGRPVVLLFGSFT